MMAYLDQRTRKTSHRVISRILLPFFILSVLVHQSLHGQRQGLLKAAIQDNALSPGETTKPPRILTYITTHLSIQHYAFLEGCWPKLLASLPLFQRSDFMMFVTAEEQPAKQIDMDLLRSIFARTGITVHVRPNPGYQEGAAQALAEAYKNGWFEGYDWVVRVNPDVLIRNDTFLRESMADANIHGIFVDCLDKPCPGGRMCVDRQTHTDFFAIRPEHVSRDHVLTLDNRHAEAMATAAFAGIVRNGTDAWLPGAGPHNGFCRVGGASSPVVHDHANLWTCTK